MGMVRYISPPSVPRSPGFYCSVAVKVIALIAFLLPLFPCCRYPQECGQYLTFSNFLCFLWSSFLFKPKICSLPPPWRGRFPPFALPVWLGPLFSPSRAFPLRERLHPLRAYSVVLRCEISCRRITRIPFPDIYRSSFVVLFGWYTV